MQNDPSSSMPESTKKSLEAECQKEAACALKNPLSKEPYPIGQIGDFEPEELLHPPKGCKIFISHGVVYSHSGENPPHARAHNSVTSRIRDVLYAKFGFAIQIMTSATISVINENGCHPSFGKIPDAIVGVYNGSTNVETPVIAVEVSNTHESIDLLMREGEVLLNQHTRLNYVLLVDLSFDETRITTMRFILCRRLQNDVLLEKQQQFQKYSCKKNSKQNLTEKNEFFGCRLDNKSSNEVAGKDLEEFYQFKIISDVVVNRQNIQPVIIQFDEALLFVGTHLEGPNNEIIKIIITENMLHYIFLAPLN